MEESEKRNPSLAKWWLLLTLLVHVSLLCWSAVSHSPTPDEIAHVAAGLSHWQTSDFSLYRVNPPLARMVATLPIYLCESSQQQWLSLYADPGDFGRTEFSVGNAFIEAMGSDYFRWITWARLATIPFSVLGAVVCFAWASELYGNRAGWLALWLWCFSPMVLAFGAIVTPDVPSAATGALAMYLFWRWIRSGRWESAYLAGVGLGLAELTKSTWIILPPIMMGLWVLYRLSSTQNLASKSEGRRGVKHELPQFAAMFFVAWLVLMAGYGFQGAFRPLGQYGFQSELLRGKTDVLQDRAIGNRFQGTWLESLPVPLPKQYVVGFDYHKADVEPGNKLAYLGGELRESGWWYYYLYALGVKCTVGGLVLFLSATVYRFARRRRWPQIDEWVLLAPMLAVLILLSYHTGLNKHARYALPIFPLAIIWSSQCASRWKPFQESENDRNSVLLNAGVLGCAAVATVSSLLCYPHNMSYFNELVGGPKNGRFHLLNSNVDWAQDLYFLKDELARRGWSKVGIATTASYDIRIIGLEFFLPPIKPTLQSKAPATPHAVDVRRLQPGRYAISACLVHGYPDSVPDGAGGWEFCDAHAFSYFQEFKPIGMVGYSTLLYDISSEDIANSETWGID